MNIVIGCDEAAYRLKEIIKEYHINDRINKTKKTGARKAI